MTCETTRHRSHIHVQSILINLQHWLMESVYHNAIGSQQWPPGVGKVYCRHSMQLPLIVLWSLESAVHCSKFIKIDCMYIV